MKIRLTFWEMFQAGLSGFARHCKAIFDGRDRGSNRKGIGFDDHMAGAIGEYAASKMLGCCWTPQVGTIDTHQGDLPGNVQVKTVWEEHKGLIVREHDPDDFRYYLVCLQLPAVELVGWIDGASAKIEKNWQPQNLERGFHHSCWLVARRNLNPIDHD